MQIQNFDRREMLSLTTKGALAAAAVGSVSVMEGCNIQQWIQTALTDLPTLLQIVTSIISLASAPQGGIDPAAMMTVNNVGAQVKSDLQLAQTTLATYQAAASSAKPGILGKVDAALATALNGLNSILSAFHISNQTLEATIAASLGSAITITLAIQALIPPPPAAASARMSLSNSKDQTAAMKTAYNLIVGKNYPNAVI